ncbi:MAG: helix-turn-helix transcriptional regulator [Rhodospirillales bacterium]|nr:helix-turn-helix transcriptional regulator [Rhodospirillales bacterium]MCB9996751.1 helix-turn-helix transcriptional regulator [Rhodospirillales bacterium]
MSIATTKDITIDRQIGQNLRTLRQQAGMSQQDLGKHLGISYQQIQKYEHGTNRLSATNLWVLCRIFGVPSEYFFHGLGGKPVPVMALLDDDPQTITILRKLRSVNDPDVKSRIIKMMTLMMAKP